MKLANNDDADSGCRIGFYARSQFSLNAEWGKNAISFGIDNSLSLHTDNRKKDVSVLAKGPTNRLDDTTITAEAKYYVNMTKPRNNRYLSLHHNCDWKYFKKNFSRWLKFYDFSVIYDTISVSDIEDVCKYLMNVYYSGTGDAMFW